MATIAAVAPGGSSNFVFRNTVGGTITERMRITSAGNVGIGTSSPAQKLTLSNGTFHINGTSTFVSNVEIGRVGGDNNMGFATGGTERMRLTSAGDLLVKLTSESAWTNTAGFATRSTGSTTITRSSAQPLLVNRLSTDGDIAVFYKDGAPVGSIGSYGGGTRLYAGSGSTGLGYFNSDSSIAPMNPSTQSKP
jgi:hypothetical protein